MKKPNFEIPDFMKYQDKFSDNKFIAKITKIAKYAGSKVVYAALVLYYTLKSNSVPLKEKAIIIGALGYFISPIDVIPDAIPIAGLSDDLAVLLYVLDKIWIHVPSDVKSEAHEKLHKWFDDDEIKEVDELWEKE